ncbi:MAG: sigma-54 dependent transcriptional regulator [Syntrophales bacterium]|nr:sigma-54 dependent transcriptional regulator [Syntrophales bacterium]MDD5642743.1 sigma-54 dependent transcriptional regulator [Syntrophales bacterium]
MSIIDFLIVDDDPLVCDSLKEMLLLEGYQVDTATGGEQALAKLNEERFRIIISDIQMPGINGLELLRELKGRSPDTPIIFITGHGHIDGAVEAIKLGAYDYITKPIEDLRLKLTLRRALEKVALQDSYQNLKKRLRPWELAENLVFKDRKMGQLLELVHTIADTMATVLITGESGTGKSLLARYIHDHSARREGPFGKISGGSLSETLLESELFGHVRGAFTGAIRDKKGKFEEAHGGTIFLDDINTASLNLQTKLLRVLQEKVIERVGGNTPIQTDVRIITATNTSLQEEVANRNFREDLYYRINVVNLDIPPLRERLSDIEPLIEHFIQRFNRSHNRRIKGLAPSAVPLCLRYSWPGNVRELENVTERAVLLSPGEFIVPEALPPEVKAAGQTGPAASGYLNLEEALGQAEREILWETLERFQWNRQHSARALGISRTTLFNKMKKLQLLDPRRQTGAYPTAETSGDF